MLGLQSPVLGLLAAQPASSLQQTLTGQMLALAIFQRSLPAWTPPFVPI